MDVKKYLERSREVFYVARRLIKKTEFRGYGYVDSALAGCDLEESYLVSREFIFLKREQDNSFTIDGERCKVISLADLLDLPIVSDKLFSCNDCDNCKGISVLNCGRTIEDVDEFVAFVDVTPIRYLTGTSDIDTARKMVEAYNEENAYLYEVISDDFQDYIACTLAGINNPFAKKDNDSARIYRRVRRIETEKKANF